MVKLASVLIHPRRIRRDRSLAPAFGLVLAPIALWLIIIAVLRMIAP